MNTKYPNEVRIVTVCIIAAIAMLALSTNVFAHGDQQHVMGTVTQIDATSITVKTTTGEVKTVMIAADTKFEKGGVSDHTARHKGRRPGCHSCRSRKHAARDRSQDRRIGKARS